MGDDKVVKRKRQYEKKKMIRAAERLAIKAQAERGTKIANESQKEEFERQMSEYGRQDGDISAVEAAPRKKSRWGTTEDGNLKWLGDTAQEAPCVQPTAEAEAEVEEEA